MPLLLAGFVLVFAALFSWSVGAEFSWLRYESSGFQHLFGALVLAPTLAAWAAAELVQVASARRVFDPRRRTRTTRVLMGASAGVCAAVLAAAILPWADRALPDAAVFGFSGLAVMGLFVACCSRIRPGHCVHCGYDLRHSPGPGQPGAGRCQECGAGTHLHAPAAGPSAEVAVP